MTTIYTWFLRLVGGAIMLLAGYWVLYLLFSTIFRSYP